MQRTVLRSVVLTAALAGPALLAQQRQPGPAVSAPPRAISADVFSGVWDYNEALSVDAATGRPERAPRSATQRLAPRDTGTASGAPRGGPGSRTSGFPREGGAQDGFDEARRAMSAVIAAERRTLVRDLLEVPEQLTIRATQDAVTFVDDLDRERTYSTNGTVQKYQLSAARFEARGGWHGTYFRKDIEGSHDFRMSETYFISEDGNRLYVIIRIGDPKRPETLAGVNRVYDRVGTAPTR